MSSRLRSDPPAEAITSPQRYRELRPGIDGYRLVSATLTVTLLDDPRRARYEYELQLETVGNALARYWCYHVPAGADELDDLRAWDARGKLHARLLSGDGAGTRIELRLRQPVRTGERYTFSYGYEADLRTVVAVDGRVRTVTYSDWVIFNIPCDALDVHVELPPGATPLAVVPAAGEEEPGRVTHLFRDLRALETASFLVAYERPAARGYRRIARAITAGLFHSPAGHHEPPQEW